MPKGMDPLGQSREVFAAERFQAANLARIGQTLPDGVENLGRAAEEQFVIFAAGQNFLLRIKVVGGAEALQFGMFGRRVGVQVNGQMGRPGDVRGVTGQAIADVHDTGDTMVGQNGRGVEAGPGVEKALHQSGEPLISLHREWCTDSTSPSEQS